MTSVRALGLDESLHRTATSHPLLPYESARGLVRTDTAASTPTRRALRSEGRKVFNPDRVAGEDPLQVQLFIGCVRLPTRQSNRRQAQHLHPIGVEDGGFRHQHVAEVADL